MAAQALSNARSGRLFKMYLFGWGLLATGGLIYMAMIFWQPRLAPMPPPRSQLSEPEPDPGLRAAAKALAEVGTVRRTVGDLQNDVGQIKDTIERREAQDKTLHSRLTTLEERVSTLTVAAATLPPPPAAPQVAEKAQAKVAAMQPKVHQAQKGRTPRIINVEHLPSAPEPQAAASEPPALETGSIPTTTAGAITFGEAVVTPSQSSFGIQLGAGHSLDALRLNWSMLVERHGSPLASLQPRFVRPRAEGGLYRLVAGPLPTRSQADQICAEMGVGRSGCFSTTFIGEPL